MKKLILILSFFIAVSASAQSVVRINRHSYALVYSTVTREVELCYAISKGDSVIFDSAIEEVVICSDTDAALKYIQNCYLGISNEMNEYLVQRKGILYDPEN